MDDLSASPSALAGIREAMAESAPDLVPLTTDEGRRLARTHLFVAATFSFANGSSPVHIRNMSPSGALIEGAVLPDQGEAATLRRGSLEAKVKVVWKAGRKAGLSFLSTVHVPDWMSKTLPSHQARVDDVIRDIRAGQAGSSTSPIERAIGADDPSIEAELQHLRNELSSLENVLVGDAAVVMAHPEIQLLDIALQRIDRIIARVRPS
jgi:hypothetical protein